VVVGERHFNCSRGGFGEGGGWRKEGGVLLLPWVKKLVHQVLMELLYWTLLLQHTATRCNTLQHTAAHCNTLQHTATWTLLAKTHELELQFHLIYSRKYFRRGARESDMDMDMVKAKEKDKEREKEQKRKGQRGSEGEVTILVWKG